MTEVTANKTTAARAKLATQEYGREITPEQYEAVTYFAKEEADAYRGFVKLLPSYITVDETLANKNAAMMERNFRESIFKIGNLDGFVEKYKAEKADPELQAKNREKRIQKRKDDFEKRNATFRMQKIGGRL